MPSFPLIRTFRQTVSTLKFKVVALTVLTAITAAMGAVQIALDATIMDFERSVMTGEAADAERTAALLGDKLGMLQSTLRAVEAATPPQAWLNPALMTDYLRDKPAINALFDVVLAIDPAGDQLSRLEKGVPKGQLGNLSKEESVIRAMQGDQPVVSKPLISPLLKVPVVALLQPSVGPAGTHRGILIGTLRLQAAELFSQTARVAGKGTREIVIDRQGMVLSHSDALQIMRPVDESPGMASMVTEWLEVGAPIDMTAQVRRTEGFFVALAGIPGSDWALVRITDEVSALEAVELARQRGWKISGMAGVLSGVLAGILVWFAAMPITRLRQEVERLTQDPQQAANWPLEGGEIGRLSTAFAGLIAARQRHEVDTQALLRQLQAVMDHAQVGIALSRNREFQLANAQLHRMLGVKDNGLIGQALGFLHSAENDLEHIGAQVLSALTREGRFQGEHQIMRANGERFWCQLHATAIDPCDLSAGVIWTFQDIHQERQERAHLSWAATHDPLTGLVNRAGFDQVLTQACKDTAIVFSTLFIDLDRFKAVNDTGGHDAGDAMLQAVAQIVTNSVRHSDVVARLGGDEFAVLLSNCPAAQAAAVGDKILKAIDHHTLEWEGHRFQVGASIGLVTSKEGLTTPARVLKAADKACYTAKRGGRNCMIAADCVDSDYGAS